jgi:signal transduction histidine kinase
MRERASAIDAKFDIESDVGEGTIITLQFNKQDEYIFNR